MVLYRQLFPPGPTPNFLSENTAIRSSTLAGFITKEHKNVWKENIKRIKVFKFKGRERERWAWSS